MELIHKELNLIFLSERRKYFMLILMYKLSKVEENVNRYRPEILLRTGPKVKMKIDFTDRERVLRSPYYVCNRLWDKLDNEIQHSENVVEFKNKLRKLDLSIYNIADV